MRIDVTAAGVNFVDALFVQGLLPDQAARCRSSPAARSQDGSARSAPSVTRFAVGDRVFSNGGLGGYASEVVVDARRVGRNTRRADRRSGGDVHAELRHRVVRAAPPRSGASPGSGCWCSVPVAASGSAAVDVGHAMGLHVIAAASTRGQAQRRAEPRCRGGHRLVDRGRQGAGARDRRATATASTWCTTRSAARRASRRCARSATTASSWSSASRPARSRCCRPTRCCCATGASPASSGAAGWPRTLRPTPTCSAEVLASIERRRAASGRAGHLSPRACRRRSAGSARPQDHRQDRPRPLMSRRSVALVVIACAGFAVLMLAASAGSVQMWHDPPPSGVARAAAVRSLRSRARASAAS